MNARSRALMESARNHLDKADQMMQRAGTVPNWAGEMLLALTCLLDAEQDRTPSIMQSARKAQGGQTDGKR